MVVLVAVGAGFAVVLFLLAELAAGFGWLALLSGERIERCRRCHRLGVTREGEVHPDGCPAHHVGHLGAALAQRVHDGHSGVRR